MRSNKIFTVVSRLGSLCKIHKMFCSYWFLRGALVAHPHHFFIKRLKNCWFSICWMFVATNLLKCSSVTMCSYVVFLNISCCQATTPFKSFVVVLVIFQALSLSPLRFTHRYSVFTQKTTYCHISLKTS